MNSMYRRITARILASIVYIALGIGVLAMCRFVLGCKDPNSVQFVAFTMYGFVGAYLWNWVTK